MTEDVSILTGRVVVVTGRPIGQRQSSEEIALDLSRTRLVHVVGQPVTCRSMPSADGGAA